MTSQPQHNILTTAQLTFEGVSHISIATEEAPRHAFYFLADTLRTNPPKVKARVKDGAQFLAILKGFFAVVAKGLLYQPSTEVASELAQIQSLMASNKGKRGAEFYTKLFDFMAKDPAPLRAGLDPLLTVRDGVCYLEAFDRSINTTVMLRLNPSLWEDGAYFKDGTAAINLTPDLIQDLQGLDVKYPIDVHIGTNVGCKHQMDHWKAKNELSKKIPLGLEDVRALLIMQASSALSTHSVDMVRIDIFNALRTLRMNKAKTHKSFPERDLADIVFNLNPGEVPYMEIQPWGFKISCQSEIYTGKKMHISVGKNRRRLLSLNAFLPYISTASFTLFENHLHYCLDIGNTDFQCSVVLAGFSTKVWYRRLQMESMLPPFQDRSEQASFKRLDADGIHVLTGDETLRARKVLISEILRGDAVFLPLEQTFLKRSLFGQELKMHDLKELGPQDSYAHQYVQAECVDMKAHYTRDEKLNFEGSTVTEPLKKGESTPFVAAPRFELHPDGLLRWVGCTCTPFKSIGEHGFGGPCEHLRALWLVYCQKIEALREAKDAGEDTGPRLEEEVRLTKSTEERIIHLDLRRTFMISEHWKRGDMTTYRHNTQVFSSEDSVRRAFSNRCEYLKMRGFTVLS